MAASDTLPLPRRRFAPLPPPASLSHPLLGSLIGKFVLLLIVFVAVPLILYSQFRQADSEKQTLLLEGVREQGRLLAENLRPTLEVEQPSPLLSLPAQVERLATVHTGLRVLFRPAGESGAAGFYFVAAQPAVPPAALEAERERLIERGIFQNLDSSCQGELPMALRNRRSGGEEELLTSITPINTKAGCWVVVTTHSTKAFLGTSIDQPYWQTVEVRIAIVIYLAMALLTIGVFISIWRSLMRFRRLAHGIRTGATPLASFKDQNQVPELAEVAEEFDRMTRALQDSANGIRHAAEDNAHAFKTPIAIMRQSLAPLRRIVPADHRRGQRAIDVLEESVDRLDHLVACARRLDETTAELIDAPRHAVNLSRLVERMLAAYGDTLAARAIRLHTRLQPRVVVSANEDLLETVIENVVDNAIDLSRGGMAITIELRIAQGRAELAVRDQGPGVPEPLLLRIFERYVSLRPRQDGELSADDGRGRRSANDVHPGIGLWIVRRNLEALGGAVRAENQPEGGLAVVMQLPLAA